MFKFVRKFIMDSSAVLRMVCISDTHTHHDRVQLPQGDILVHSGDLTYSGRGFEIESFANWLDKQTQFKHKIVIAGNHDVTLDAVEYTRHLRAKFHRQLEVPENPEAIKARLKKSCIYLENESCVIEGYKFWGSPYTPEFCDWAFQLQKQQSEAFWSQIPNDTDVVITHGPPAGVLDKVKRGGQSVGCEALYNEITQRIKPRYHVFGHIHEASGMITKGPTTFINAATCTLQYKPTNLPIVVTLPVRN